MRGGSLQSTALSTTWSTATAGVRHLALRRVPDTGGRDDMARLGSAGRVWAGHGWLGRRGSVWHGKAGMAGRGMARHGKAGRAWQGGARHG